MRAQLFFDLACPFTYLAAERVERAFAHVTWTAASSETLQRRCLADDAESVERVRARPSARAATLRLPLVWPEGFPKAVPAAMRAAAFAAEQGRGGAFVLAAGRLAFCGGFDLDDPEILAEAAAAAGIRLDECLRAAGDARRDGVDGGGGPPPAGRGRGPAAGAAGRALAVLGRAARRRGRGGGAPGDPRVRARVSAPPYGLTSPARICAFIASTVSGRSASSVDRREDRPRRGRTR